MDHTRFMSAVTVQILSLLPIIIDGTKGWGIVLLWEDRDRHHAKQIKEMTTAHFPSSFHLVICDQIRQDLPASIPVALHLSSNPFHQWVLQY